MDTQVGICSFLHRQVEGSSFSYFKGTWEELAKLANEHWESRVASTEPGKETTMLIPVPVDQFMSGTIPLEPGEWVRMKFQSRGNLDEEPRLTSPQVIGKPHVPAAQVHLVACPRDELGESASTDREYEIIVIAAASSELPDGKPEPMDPITSLHNIAEKLSDMSQEEKAAALDSVVVSNQYWSNKAQIGFRK